MDLYPCRDLETVNSASRFSRHTTNFTLMALITPSAVIGEITGSVGSECFGRNMGGAYVRSKPIVPYQRTAQQAIWRNYLKAVVAAWKALSESQRMVYQQFAKDYQSGQRLGQSNTLTGYTLFMRQQLIYYRTGAPLGFSNPSNRLKANYNVVAGAFTTTSMPVTITKVGVDSAASFVIKMSPLLSPGVLHPNPHVMKQLYQSSFTGAPIVYDLYTVWNSYYGAAVSGKRIAFAFSTFNGVSGEATKWLQSSTLIA
jgi:hypothetical protein